MNSDKKLYREAPEREFDYLVKQIRIKFEEANKRPMKDRDLADICMLKPAMISMYLNGKRSPSERTLRILRAEVAGVRPPPGLPIDPPPSGKLINEMLHDLESCDPEAYATAKAMIQTLHKRLKKPSRKPSLRDLATQAHPLRAEVSEPKLEADTPSGSKPVPHTPASPRPKVQPTAPALAPTGHKHSNDS